LPSKHIIFAAVTYRGALAKAAAEKYPVNLIQVMLSKGISKSYSAFVAF
jgi:hypothetical protein